ncbi:hypothetical protein PR048_015565 [Dryococelus australis]|uniref:HAT C-terminal dimerisation domain-containing protein n=1 Tax=Dryococelus australis TaxID=614101 RepID=A0ABQ9HH97_9NEOP|nr:hypothetical protein PR048_015565 [Dryococelus australis]
MKVALNETNYMHWFCFSHSLQFAVSDAKTSTPNITQLIYKARKLVGHYNRSCKATARLDKVQENMQLPKLKLIQNIPSHHLNGWRLTDSIVKVLRSFTEATKKSSGNTYPTASMVIPTIHCLKAATENYVKKNINGHGTEVPFARNLLKALTSRFPSFKMDYINCVATIKEILDVTVDKVHNDGIQDHQVEAAPTAPHLARHCNPHYWWIKNQHLYPAFAKVTAHYLALPATQVASERVFSTARNIDTCRRELLLPRLVDEHTFTFLHDKLKMS